MTNDNSHDEVWQVCHVDGVGSPSWIAAIHAGESVVRMGAWLAVVVVPESLLVLFKKDGTHWMGKTSDRNATLAIDQVANIFVEKGDTVVIIPFSGLIFIMLTTTAGNGGRGENGVNGPCLECRSIPRYQEPENRESVATPEKKERYLIATTKTLIMTVEIYKSLSCLFERVMRSGVEFADLAS